MRRKSGPSGLARRCRHSVWACVQLCLHPSTVGTRALEHPLSDPLAVWGAWEGTSGFAHPGVSEGVERRGITTGARDGLGLMSAPVQLAGEVKSCILVVPVASQCHENRLGCCSSSSRWEISHLFLLCISSRTFFLQ